MGLINPFHSPRGYVRAELCGVCRESLIADGRKVIEISRGANQKVTCSVCGKRRYGGTYEFSKKAVVKA